MGAAVVPLLVAWSACFALDFRNVLFYGALSCMVSSVVAFVVSVLSPIAAGIVWCLCALVGAAAPVILVMRRPALGMTQTDAAGDHAIAVGEDVTRQGLAPVFTDFVSTLWLPLLGLLVCMCCSCMGETELNGRVVRGEFVGLIVASAPAIALCCVRTKTPIVLLAEKLVAPVLVACGIILGGLPSEGAESLGAHYVFVPMVFISLYALASVMAMRGMSRLLVAGITLSACCVAMLVGSALAFAADSRAGTGPYVRLVTFVYYVVVLLDLAYTTWRLMARGSRDEVDGLPATSRPETFEETIAQRMDELVRDYGLTAREREVCEYLWHGYNSGHIAKALLISGNTARTHIRNIYRKLGVSSREELLALFSSRAGDRACRVACSAGGMACRGAFH